MNIALKTTLGALAVSLVASLSAQAQTVIYTFTDGTSQGWANAGFSDTPVASVVNIAGNNWLSVPRVGFQSANVTSSTSTDPNLAAAMVAAGANPSGYQISYDWYINTATWTGGSYLQIGTFVNTGSGYYAQSYSTPLNVQLDGTQMTSGSVFSGTVTYTFSAAAYAIPTADTFFRLGLIVNSDGTGAVDFDNISISPVPEPSTLALAGLGFAGLIALRRRQA